MTPPDWWYTGLLVGLTIFFCLLLGLCGLMIKWGTKQVDKLDADFHMLDETQKAFEADMKKRLWPEDDLK